MNTMNAVIFDLDGVLVFTDKFHYQAWKKMADRMGIYFDEEINNRLRGVSRMDSLDIVLERYEGTPLTAEEKETLAAEKNETYRELLKTMTPDDVTDEVRKTLAELKKRGYKIAIGSSSKNTKFILERVGLSDVFDAVSDGNNITKSKPDPEVFVKAAEYLGEKPQNCLVVEDAEAGIEAGLSGGMKTAAIGDAVRCKKGDFELSTFSDLLLLPCLAKKGLVKVHTDKAPAAVGPYSQAIIAGNMVYSSGQIPLNPATGEIVGNDITTQTEQIMKNLGAVLEEAGTSFEQVVKTTCFLADMNDFAAFNAVYEKYFTGRPARSCVAVKTLPKNVLAEVELTAML